MSIVKKPYHGRKGEQRRMVKSLFATTGHTAVMAQRREPPDALDYFPTPPWATRALFRHVLPAIGAESMEVVWEPACGAGHMAEVIAEFASGQVIASDIFQYGYGQAPHDFLHDETLVRPEWIITNPPFNLACEFTLRALDLASDGVAMLCRTSWIEGRGRFEKLFRDRPPAIFAPFVERVPMVKGRWDPDAATATSYAWFIWLGGVVGAAHVHWIAPGCRVGLTRLDDRQRFASWKLVPAAAPLLDDECGISLDDQCGFPSLPPDQDD